jgi:hypothetical protein
MGTPTPLRLLSLVLLISGASCPAAFADSSSRNVLATWVIADIDGDYRPDLITGLQAQNIGSEIGSIRVEHQFSGVPSSPTGLISRIHLTARDIDFDSDLDILVRDEFAERSIAWWVNDGIGNFKPGDLELLPNGPERTYARSVVAGKSVASALNQRRNIPVNLIRPPAAKIAPLERKQAFQRSIFAILAELSRYPEAVRGPPAHS